MGLPMPMYSDVTQPEKRSLVLQVTQSVDCCGLLNTQGTGVQELCWPVKHINLLLQDPCLIHSASHGRPLQLFNCAVACHDIGLNSQVESG